MGLLRSCQWQCERARLQPVARAGLGVGGGATRPRRGSRGGVARIGCAHRVTVEYRARYW